MNMHFLPSAAACTLLSLLALTPAQAEIYKWTDANGVVQYSQTPPAGETKAQEIAKDISLSSGKAAKPAEADSTATDATDATTDNPDADLAKARTDGQQNQVKHHEFCDQQRGALKQLLANPVIRWKSADEAEHILTAKERANKIDEFEKNIASMCNEKVLPNKKPVSTH